MESKDQQQQQQQKEEQQKQQIPYGLFQPCSSSTPSNFIRSNACYRNKQEHGAYDLGELDQALILYLDGDQAQIDHDHSDQRQTLNIFFPSQPMHEDPAPASAVNLGSSKKQSSDHHHQKSMEVTANKTTVKDSKPPLVKPEGNNRRGGTGTAAASSSEHEGPKTPDPRTLRRLAQNREAARKSRLRKKAYVQQLESSRHRLIQLEQELQRTRVQVHTFGSSTGVFYGDAGALPDQGLPDGISALTSEAAMFDMEYTRWLEDHHRLMTELRAALQEQLPENDLRMFVESCLAHYNEMVNLKSMTAKTDVFHIVSGVWKTPAERCFMWMGGFRPSDLIKIVVRHVEPLSEQQILGICGLQQSTQETEDALTQGLDALHHSLSETIAANDLTYTPNMAAYMGQMAAAMNKLSTLEAFVHQADNLRHQTLHRLHQILTVYQAARGFLAVAEYFHRLRALSSLWLARPRQD
ncbi:putative Transcription factor [Zostera marina]|uniref:Putative Transcription factor n=1 Tax=Zostera marina TaxID=29655 RepID=A0A0K9Q594_ZOSMR|nr:putative Transcription factor [Zostera marina]